MSRRALAGLSFKGRWRIPECRAGVGEALGFSCDSHLCRVANRRTAAPPDPFDVTLQVIFNCGRKKRDSILITLAGTHHDLVGVEINILDGATGRTPADADPTHTATSPSVEPSRAIDRGVVSCSDSFAHLIEKLRLPRSLWRHLTHYTWAKHAVVGKGLANRINNHVKPPGICGEIWSNSKLGHFAD